MKNSRVASALETAEGRVIAGDRDDLQTKLGKAVVEKLKIQGKEEMASQHIEQLEATLDLTDKKHRVEVYMCCYVTICVNDYV